jgi:hypothetical protein
LQFGFEGSPLLTFRWHGVKNQALILSPYRASWVFGTASIKFQEAALVKVLYWRFNLKLGAGWR